MRFHRSTSPDFELIGIRAEASKVLGLPEQLTPEENQIADDAGRFFTLVLEADSEAAWVYFQRGLSFASAKEWERAIADFSKVITALPDRAVVWHQRANAYRQLKKWDPAIADFSEAIKLDPRNVNALNERGLVYLNGLGNADAAVRDFSRAIEVSPGNTALGFNRGVALNRLLRWADAVADFDAAIKQSPNDPRSWAERGFSHFQLGRNERAAADLTRAIELEPDNARNRQTRAAALYRLGEYERAVADLTKAIERAPNAAMFVERAGNYALLGRRKEALADLDRALAIAPPAFAPTVHQTLAYFLNDGFVPEYRDPKGAMDAANKMLKVSPKSGVAWSSLGRSQYLAGDYKSALESLTKSTDLRTDISPHLVFRAMAHWKLGQPDEARRWYTQWAGRLEQTRASWEGNRPTAEIWNRYRAEAVALWGNAIPEPAPPPRTR